MRILFAAHQFFPEHYAGVEIVTLGLAQELRNRGHETYVLAPKRIAPTNDIRPGEIEKYEYGGVPVCRVGRPKEGIFRPYRLGYENEVMAQRTREYMREVRPDIIHVEHFQGLSASVIPVFKEFGAPIVYTATDFWTICPVVDLRRHDGIMCKGPELTHCTRCVVSRLPDSPRGILMKNVMDKIPNAALRTAGRLSETPLSKTFPLQQVWALKERPGYIREHIEQVDHIIAYTQLMRDLLLANAIGEGGKIGVSYYGINTSHIPKAPRNQNVPSPLRVGFIGTVAPHKGCDILIRAFRTLPQEPEATLDVYGNLERFEFFSKELRRLARGDERINFAGPFPRERVGQVLSSLDVLVVPSRWYENQPGVIFEAFAAGIPVVATDLGGMSEFVKHEENGLLFELENVEDLGRQLRRLSEEPGLLEELSAGIGHVKTIEENVTELEELYARLVKERGR
jgi:glycosyltransferase involved in cell wall biosynthesis